MDELLSAQCARLEAASMRLNEAARYVEALSRLDKDLQLPPDVFRLRLNFYGVDIEPPDDRGRQWLLQIREEIAAKAAEYESARKAIIEIAAETPCSE